MDGVSGLNGFSNGTMKTVIDNALGFSYAFTYVFLLRTVRTSYAKPEM